MKMMTALLDTLLHALVIPSAWRWIGSDMYDLLAFPADTTWMNWHGLKRFGVAFTSYL